MLTSRERLQRCYLHQELDRPGIYSRTAFPENDPSYDSLRRLFETKTDLKVRWRPKGIVSTTAMLTQYEPYSTDFQRRIDILPTPMGNLTKVTMLGLQGQPPYIEKHLLSDADDVEKYLSLPMPKIGGDVSSFQASDVQIGDRGIVEANLGTNPAGQVAELFGSETFAMMTVTDRPLVHTLCERQMKVMLETVDFLLANKRGPFFSMQGEEYVVPPLHGPRDFFDFNVRYDKPILDKIHDAGGRVHIHCHGPIQSVLDGFLDMRVDVLHPIEPPPMGDITVKEAKARLRGRICIEGNIQIADLYEKTPDEIRDQTKELICDAFDDHRGLIISPTASPYIPGEGERCLEQYKAMIETVLTWSA